MTLNELQRDCEKLAIQIESIHRLRELDRAAILRLQGRVLALEEKASERKHGKRF